MYLLGILLLFLASPLLIIYFISENKNEPWKRLGILLAIVGILIILISMVVGY